MEKALGLLFLVLTASGCGTATTTTGEPATVPVPAPPPPSSQPYPLSSADLAEIEVVVSNAMKDLGSAQFRNVKAVQMKDGYVKVCGEVNAKSSFGANSGFSPFVGSLRPGRFKLDLIAGDASEPLYIHCSEIGASLR